MIQDVCLTSSEKKVMRKWWKDSPEDSGEVKRRLSISGMIIILYWSHHEDLFLSLIDTESGKVHLQSNNDNNKQFTEVNQTFYNLII